MSHKLIVVTACAAIASVVTATDAFAVTPKAGQYSQVKGNRSYMSFQVSKGHVVGPVHYDNCVTVPMKMPSIKISNGKFTWSGKVSDYINRTYQVHVDGHWVTGTKAKGNWSAKRLNQGSCTSTYAYTVTLYTQPSGTTTPSPTPAPTSSGPNLPYTG